MDSIPKLQDCYSCYLSQIRSVEPHGAGHVHKTFRVVSGSGTYLLQRLSQGVFGNCDDLMRNIAKVCDALADAGPEGLTVPSLLRTDSGSLCYHDDSGVWRLFNFIEQTRSVEYPSSPQLAFDAAVAVGQFINSLQHVEGLVEVLPGFQDMRARFATLRAVTDQTRASELALCQEVVARVFRGLPHVEAVQSKATPLRNTHGDLKFNNILLAEHTDSVIALVDLDTCAPGRVYYDFGDFIRAASATAAEDNPADMSINTEFVQSLTKGFRKGIGESISPPELDQCVGAPAAVSYTLAARFLADHLSGDKYFNVAFSGQNLLRARAQLVLAESFRDLEDQIGVWLRSN